MTPEVMERLKEQNAKLIEVVGTALERIRELLASEVTDIGEAVLRLREIGNVATKAALLAEGRMSP